MGKIRKKGRSFAHDKTFPEGGPQSNVRRTSYSLAHKIEKDSFKSILRFMNENIELEDFLRFLRTWLTASWMQHNIEIKNGSYYRFNIQHDLGIKWSLYVKTLVSELCHDVLNITVDVKIDDNLISLVFREYP